MNDYVTKPVSPQVLAAVLEKWLAEEKDEGRKRMLIVETLHDSSSIFDRAAMLERLMDDEELARTILDGFLEDIPRQIEALRGYLEAGDAPGAGRQAHTIMGAAANVGGERLREAAFEMEKAAKAGDLSAVKARMADLEAQFGRLKEAMRTGI